MEAASPKKNNRDMLYYNDLSVKMQIDEVLHQNVMIFQNLGINSSKSEVQAAKVQEKKNLRAVRHLDPSFIDGLLYEA